MSDGAMTIDAAVVAAATARRPLPAHGSRRGYALTPW